MDVLSDEETGTCLKLTHETFHVVQTEDMS